MKKSKITNLKRDELLRNKITLVVAGILIIGSLGVFLQQRINRINSTIITKNFTLKDIRWYEQPDSEAMAPAPEGQRYITVRFTAKNNGSVSSWLTPVNQSYVIDGSSAISTIQLVANDEPFQAGSMESKETRSGELSFLIPYDQPRAGFCFYVTDIDGSCVLLDNKNKII